jgi:hypothetical protein
MDHRWVRILGVFQIVGSLMMFSFSLTPHLSDVQFHVNVPIASWVFASISFLAGVLLIGLLMGLGIGWLVLPIVLLATTVGVLAISS